MGADSIEFEFVTKCTFTLHRMNFLWLKNLTGRTFLETEPFNRYEAFGDGNQ